MFTGAFCKPSTPPTFCFIANAGACRDEVGNDFNTRIQGTRIRHQMGMHAANARYLAFMATIDNPNAGLKAIDKMSQPVRDGDRSYRGFNLFQSNDYDLFLTLARGEWCISGFRAADLRAGLPWLTPSRCSYLLKRLRTHGLIKKVGRRYKYYLTKMGRGILAAALNIRESVVLPTLCETCGA